MSTKPKVGPTKRTVPEGDNRERLVCPDCGYIRYDNPKIIVAAVCLWEDRVLLCRRAIEPRLGLWTVPAGFMEVEESTAEGAAREAWEEARARIEIDGLLGIYEIPRISQVYIVHRARMTSPDCAPGLESQEVALFAWPDIPWPELAFPSIAWALRRFEEGGPPRADAAPPGS